MAAARLGFGELLRTWRDRLSPLDAGFAVTGTRRAPGLRREELAQLASLSVDYLLRLEQGRAVNPSPQVVAALARALQLSRAERDQLYRSAGQLPPRDGTISDHVPAGIQRLTTRLGDIPIGVFTADWSLVWWNSMWKALHGDPAGIPAPERNLALALFGHGAARAAMRPTRSERGDEAFAASIVADLKDALTRYPTDAHLNRLVQDLRQGSRDFAQLWATATTAQHVADRKTIIHPEVGELLLDCDVLLVPGADLYMVTYTAAATTSDAGKLELLRVTGGRAVQTGPGEDGVPTFT
ncbi:helix-turn-helix transcriptional regulator [Nocardia rhizosphaerihabitans]|uniref:helix-turn-helix transcriptional regulator n=1 Tax=Nocardia rhizosphaerihabitans TaxID=1691570 RepID=UPI0036726EED